MLKRFLKDSFVYGIGNILTKGISLFLLPVYVKVLSPEDYGVIDFLLVLFTLVGVFFSLEIYQAIARYYHEFKDINERKEYLSTAFLFISISYLLFTVLIILSSKKISLNVFNTYSNAELPVDISLAAVSTYFSTLYSFSGSILRYGFKVKIFALCSFINSITTIVLSIVFVVWLHYGIRGIFLGQLIGNTLAFSVAFYNSKDNFFLYFNTKKLKFLLRYSLPLIPSSIGVFLLAYLDRIIIKYFLTITDLGIYGVANRFSSVASLIMMGLSTAITPLIYANYKKDSTPEEIAVIFSFLSSFIIIFVSGITLFSNEILYVFTAPAYYKASVLFPFLFLAGFLSKMYDFTPGLSIAKKTKTIAIVYIFGAFVTVLLDLLSIKRFGILSVAVVNLFSALLVFIVNFIFSQKYYKINYRLKSIFITCPLCVVLMLIAHRYFFEITLFSILCKLGILLLIISLPFVLRIVDIAYITKAINLRKIKT
ncbi:polysaccharide biosynthesis protein [Spirochaetia bacterium]|nr:polysaccharide biosynthesis protein [Spirochaetia bacterium]